LESFSAYSSPDYLPFLFILHQSIACFIPDSAVVLLYIVAVSHGQRQVLENQMKHLFDVLERAGATASY
jgi:hypothetical protein